MDAGQARQERHEGSETLLAGSADDGLSSVTPGAAFIGLDAGARRRLLWHAVGRILAITAFLLAVYFGWPVGPDSGGSGLFVLAAGLVGFFVTIAVQVRRIVDSKAPQLSAFEALGTAVPLFIVIFALVYVLMSQADPGSFSQPVTKVTGIYFTVTVLSTVGFGDVTAVTDNARLVVTLQMIVDLILIGLVVRLIIGASRIGVERRRAEAAAHGTTSATTSGTTSGTTSETTDGVTRPDAPREPGVTGP